MDFAQLRINTATAESMVVIHPVTGEKTDAVFYAYGKDSSAFKNKMREILERNAKAGIEYDQDRDGTELIAACVTGWSGVYSGEIEIEFSSAAVVKMLNELPWLYDQLNLFIGSRANFLLKG